MSRAEDYKDLGAYEVSYDGTTTLGTSYEDWIVAKGLVFPGNGDPALDADLDGYRNLMEFAVGSEPLVKNSVHPIRTSLETLNGREFLVLTTPVRSGAIFSGEQGLSASRDGIVYFIEVTSDLEKFNELVAESPSVVHCGLPSLPIGWEYRSFQCTPPTSDLSREFIRLRVEMED